ncbi:MAG: S41 family peptidase [Myxococcales bacterium]
MRTVAFVALCCACGTTAEFTQVDRDRVQHMLRDVSDDVREHYYDPHFQGIDWDARVAVARRQIDQSDSLNRAMSHVAGVLESLDDSHTFFLAPARPFRHDYGWRWLVVGDRCLITSVRPGSDAETKGLKRGDEVLAVNGYGVGRDSLWKIEYVYNSLRPQVGLRLVVKDLAGRERQLDVMAKVETIVGGGRGGALDYWDIVRRLEDRAYRMRAKLVRWRDIAIMKLPIFDFSEQKIAEMIDDIRGARALILDLRGNSGGKVDTLKALIGFLFGREAKIADRVERERIEPMIAPAVEGAPFRGKLVVLVDSASGSSSEVLARVVQLERRGLVIGDRTAGRVREAIHYTHRIGLKYAVFFGTSVTDADLIMTDGRSLEHTGVAPDVIALPSAADVARGLDPVLSRAVESLGGSITAEDAAELFPIEWTD